MRVQKQFKLTHLELVTDKVRAKGKMISLQLDGINRKIRGKGMSEVLFPSERAFIQSYE